MLNPVIFIILNTITGLKDCRDFLRIEVLYTSVLHAVHQQIYDQYHGRFMTNITICLQSIQFRFNFVSITPQTPYLQL